MRRLLLVFSQAPPSDALPAACAPRTLGRRGGLVGPWTALSPLIALATDPLEEVRARALRLLRQLGEKHPR